MNRYYIIGMEPAKNTIVEVFRNVKDGKIDNAVYLEPYKFRGLLLLLYKIRYNKKFRKLLRFVPWWIWKRYYALENTVFSQNDNNYVFLMPGTDIERLINSRYLKKFKEKNGNVKLILLLFDSINSPLRNNGWNKVIEVFPLFDLVATFEKNDAIKYGIHYFMDPYEKRDVRKIDERISDLYFVGHDKGRKSILTELAQYTYNNGVNNRIILVDGENRSEYGIEHSSERISYDKMLSQIMNTNCLLEILCDGQESASLRYYEAVIYGKKLLTNNSNIFELPFYNDRYMKYFGELKDIDVEWIKEREIVDYGYKDEFSVRRFFEEIAQLV